MRQGLLWVNALAISCLVSQAMAEPPSPKGEKPAAQPARPNKPDAVGRTQAPSPQAAPKQGSNVRKPPEASEDESVARQQRKEAQRERRKELMEKRQKLREERGQVKAEHQAVWRRKLDKINDDLKRTREERRAKRRVMLKKRWGTWLESKPLAGPVRAELRRHAWRIARLNRLKHLAEARDKKAMVERVETLIEKEGKRHEARMNKLKDVRPAQNPAPKQGGATAPGKASPAAPKQPSKAAAESGKGGSK